LKHSLLIILLFSFIALTNAQKNVTQSSGFDEDYYLQFWSSNQDSLKNSRIIKQHLQNVNPKTANEDRSDFVLST
jgi:hypothetical protein